MKTRNVIIVLGLLFTMPFFSSCEKDNETLEATKTSKKVANRLLLLQARGPLTISNETNYKPFCQLDSWGSPSNVVNPAHKLRGVKAINSGETAVFDNYKDVSDPSFFISQWNYRFNGGSITTITASTAKDSYAEFYDAGNPTLGKFTHWISVSGDIDEIIADDEGNDNINVVFDFKLSLPEAEGTEFTDYRRTINLSVLGYNLDAYVNGITYYMHYNMTGVLVDQGSGVIGTNVTITSEINTIP